MYSDYLLPQDIGAQLEEKLGGKNKLWYYYTYTSTNKKFSNKNCGIKLNDMWFLQTQLELPAVNSSHFH